VLFDYFLAYSQSQTSALGFRGKQWVEDSFDILITYALAGVRKFYFHIFVDTLGRDR